jgi:hypothetical protein
LNSSNQRETAAVLRALGEFKPVLKAAQIRALSVRSDNSTTVCNLQRQGAGLALLPLTKKIFKILRKIDIRLLVGHIPGKDNGDVDALSRLEVTGDYALKENLFRLGLQMLGKHPTVDLFAHNANRKLPRFVAMEGPLGAGAVAFNAFSLDWGTECVYLFPPVQLIARVLQKINEDGAQAVLVVPQWPSQAWWNLFREFQESAVLLGPSDQVLEPGPAMTQSSVTLKLPPGMIIMAWIDRSRRATTVSVFG